jgi:putative membrane protein
MNTISAINNFYRHRKTFVLTFVLVIFYTVGIFGLSSAWREDFLSLSFFNLLLSFVILLISHKAHHFKFYLFVVVAFAIGMVAEWIGVHTGFLFGNYTYGESLGLKIWEVPLIIGINWVMLTIISASCVAHFQLKWWLKALLGALLMLVLDILIEPVAIQSDYWTWEGEIPIYNFVSWFLIALFLQGWYFKTNLAESNKVAMALYGIQITFFGILLITLT